MYLEKVNIKVIGTKYSSNDKEKKGAVLSEFKFDDGINSKELNYQLVENTLFHMQKEHLGVDLLMVHK